MTDVKSVSTDYFGGFGLESREAIDRFLGTSGDDRANRIDQVNCLSEFLIETVGILPIELKTWFQQEMLFLDGATPLDVLLETDGYERVFNEARRWVLED